MVNIWDYRDYGKVKIITITGKEYEGNIISLLASEDLEDLIDNPEDTIDIENDTGIYGFKASEIAKIVRLN